MADVNKSVEIIFGATDNVSGTLGDMSSGFGSFANTASDTTISILKIEAAAATAAAAIGGLALKLAGDFQVEMKAVGTLSDASAASMQQLSTDILDFASKSTSGLSQLTKATFDAQSAGVKFEDSIIALKAAETLGVAGHTDNATAMKLLTNTMNGMGLESSDLNSISDTLFATMQGGVTTIGEMSTAFAGMTPSAKAAGVSLDEVGASFSTVTAVTGDSAKAATQLNALYNELAKPTTNLAKALAVLGIDANSSAFQTLTLAEKMNLLKESAGGSAEKTKLLFSSIEAGSAAYIITQGEMAKYNAELDRQTNKAGLTEKAHKSLIDSLDNQTKIAINSATIALVKFGQPLVDSFTNVAEGISAIFQALGVSISEGSLADITNMVNTWADGLAASAVGVAKAIPEAMNLVDFTPFLNALREVGLSLDGVFTNLDLTKPEDLAKAMNKVIEVIGGFITATSAVFEVLSTLVSLSIDLINAWGDLDPSMQKLAGTIGGLSLAFTLLAPAVTAAIAVFELFGSSAKLVEASSASLSKSFGKAGLLGASLALGAGLGTLIEKSMGESARTAIQDFIGFVDRATNGLITNADAANAYGNQTQPFDKATQAAIDNANAIEKSAAKMKDMMQVSNDAGISEADYAARLADVTAGALEKADGVGVATDKVVKSFDLQTAAQDKNIKKTEETAASLKKLQLEWNKQRNENIVKTLEIKSKVDIAQIQADAQGVTDAFASINVGLKTSSDLLGAMFGALNGAVDLGRFHVISEAIDKEQKIREREVDSQTKLNESIIEMNKAKVERLRNFQNPVLTVSAPDLSVELELVLLKILEKLQIRGNASGMDMLLQGL